jgi:hypothetical protein
MAAAEPALTLKTGAFLRAYTANQAAANELPLESPVAEAIRALPMPWTGTATELLKILETYGDDRTLHQKLWPKSPRSLSGTLRRLAPNLRGIGIAVEFDERNGGTGRRIISVRELPSPSQSSQTLAQKSKVAPTDDLPNDDCDASDDQTRTFSAPQPGPSRPESRPELEDEL